MNIPRLQVSSALKIGLNDMKPEAIMHAPSQKDKKLPVAKRLESARSVSYLRTSTLRKGGLLISSLHSA